MTTRSRHVCATALAFATVALLPLAAGAHSVDCSPALKAPAAQPFPDWSGGCTNAAPGFAAADTAALASNTARDKKPKQSELKQIAGRLFAKGAVSAFALTEPEVGSDPAKMSTTATPIENGSHYLINGLKLHRVDLVGDAAGPGERVKGLRNPVRDLAALPSR